MANFVLHPRLAQDTLALGLLPLSAARVMSDRRFPWIILVPQRPDLVGMDELTRDDASQLMTEIIDMSRLLRTAFTPDRINVGALGNLVPQLHVHVIARVEGDEAWPGPVWGAGTPIPYDEDDPQLQRIRSAFAKL